MGYACFHWCFAKNQGHRQLNTEASQVQFNKSFNKADFFSEVKKNPSESSLLHWPTKEKDEVKKSPAAEITLKYLFDGIKNETNLDDNLNLKRDIF